VLVERKSDTSEVNIATSSYSNTINGRATYMVPLQLEEDHILGTGSRIVGKLYADVSGGGSAPDLKIYYQGDTSSRWEIPASSEIFRNIFVPYADAVKSVDLGSKNVTTTGTIKAGSAVIGGLTGFLKATSGVVSTSTIDISDDTNLSVSGTLLDLTGDTLSVNEGTLTDGKGCKYVSGTGLVCDQSYLTTVDISDDTNLSVSGTLLNLTGDTLSINEGTMTTGKLCTFDGTNLVCNSDDADTQLNEEQVQDFAFTNTLGGTETLISVTYQDATNDIDFVVDNDLHKYSWTNVVDADIPNAITVTGYMQDEDINTFSKLQAWVTDATLAKLGTTTDTKYCVWASSTDEIVCTEEGGAGLWTATNGDIYRETGNVGIGTTTPSAPLTVIASSTSGILDIWNMKDDTSNQVAIFRANDRVTAADNDQGYISFYGDDDNGLSTEFARITWEMDDVTNNSKDSTLRFWTMTNNTMDSGMHLAGDNLYVSGGINLDNYISVDDGATNVGNILTDLALRVVGKGRADESAAQLRGSSQTTLTVGIGLGGITAVTNSSYGKLLIPSAGITEASSGNHPLLAQLAIKPFAITPGVATVSDTASLYIEGAATTTVVSGNNYSLWVDDVGGGGKSMIDGSLYLDDSKSGFLKTDADGLVSASSIDISDDTNLAAGRSLTLSGDSIEADAELYTFAFSFNYRQATTTDDAHPGQCIIAPTDLTITKVGCSQDNSNSSIQLEERALTSPYSAGTDILSSNLTCGTTYASTTSFSNSSISSGNRICLAVDVQNGVSTTTLIVDVSGTKND